MNMREKKICKTASDSSEEEDRISDLPQCLLYYILSFLTTKDVVKISVLSTNWKDIFLGLNNIHIDHNVNSQMARFIKRRISSSKKCPVAEFKLEHYGLPKSSVMISWISSLLMCRAKSIQILDTHYRVRGYEFQLVISVPPDLFRSGNLEILKLCGGEFVIKFPEIVNCPNLKVLHLNCFTASNITEPRNLRFTDETYPKLEELDFGIWKLYKKRVALSIFLTKLKKLAFHSMASYKGVGIDIHTPHLEHLNFMDILMPVDKSLAWMRVVEMNFRNCQSLRPAVIGHFMQPHSWTSLLWSINNVKELHLHLDFYEFPGQLLQFPQLTYLSLLNCYGGSASYFLQCAPNLETFIYDGRVASLLDSGDEVPLCLALCLAHTLREVRLKYNSEDEFAIANFFLQHGAVLQRVIIEHPRLSHSTLKRLEDMNRASKKMCD